MNLHAAREKIETALHLASSARPDVDSLRIAVEQMAALAEELLEGRVTMPIQGRRCMRFSLRAVWEYENAAASRWVWLFGIRLGEKILRARVNRKYVKWLKSNHE